jgi:hypothetical protein
MYYIGITINTALNLNLTVNLKLNYENGIIYIRKGTTAESLLIPAWELEAFKGNIRRLPKEIYDALNDDLGFHVV